MTLVELAADLRDLAEYHDVIPHYPSCGCEKCGRQRRGEHRLLQLNSWDIAEKLRAYAQRLEAHIGQVRP